MLKTICLLILIVKTNEISIGNPFIEEPKDIETLIGSTIVFRCQTESIDEHQITWCKNDFCTLGKSRDLPFYPRYEILGQSQRGEHHFQIVNVSIEDIGYYQCQILAGPRRSGSMSRKAKLTLLQIPSSLRFDNEISLIENIPSSVICRCENGMPEAKLTWKIPDEISLLSKSDYVFVQREFLRNSISNVTLLAKRSSHEQILQCQANSVALDLLNETMFIQQSISVLFSPEVKLKVIGEEIEGKTIEIHCEILSRPKWNRIEWFQGEKSLQQLNQTKIFLYLNRSMNFHRIFCQVENLVSTTNQSIQLQIQYRPEFVDSNGFLEKNFSVILVNEGENVSLECHIHSFPLIEFLWIFNGEILLRNQSKLFINSIESSKHLGFYICQMIHPVFGLFNRTIRLALQGPPEMFEDENARERKLVSSIGQSIEFRCFISLDLPVREIFWIRSNEIRLDQSNSKYEIIQHRTESKIDFRLKIANLIFSDEGKYFCQSKNEFGSSKLSFELEISPLNSFYLRSSLIYLSMFLAILFSLSFLLFLLISFYHKKKRLNSTKSISIQSQSEEQQIFKSIDGNQNLFDHWNDPTDQQEQFLHLQQKSAKYSTVV